MIAGGTEMMSYVTWYGQSLREAGVKVVFSPVEIGLAMAECLRQAGPDSPQGQDKS